MKKILICTGLLFSSLTYGQEQTKAIKLLPDLGQGYLILNNPNNEVVSWDVKIGDFSNFDDSTRRTNLLYAIELHDIDYLKVPDDILRSNKYLQFSVNGYSNTKELIISDEDVIINGPYPPISSYLPVCDWTCNGLTYAYTITQYVNEQNSASFFQLNSAFATIATATSTAIPYYRYMSESQFFDLCQTFTNITSSPCSVDGVNIIGPLDGNAVEYRDIQNNVINGNVYGVRKNLGPWAGSFVISTADQAYGDVVCPNSLEWAINVINTASGPDGQPNLIEFYGLPELSCIPAFGNQPGVTIDQECLEIAYDWVLGTHDGASGDIFDLLDAIRECEGGGAIGSTDEWWDPDLYIITGFDGNNDPTVIDVDEMFQPNGELISQNIDLTTGIYSIGVALKNGQYFPFVKEVEQAFSSTLQQKDFLDATAYPVPFTGNEFEMLFDASATVKFNYILSDLNGNEYVNRKFVLHKDHQRSHTIRSKGNIEIPSGILVNTLIFEDGSIKSFQIVKE